MKIIVFGVFNVHNKDWLESANINYQGTADHQLITSSESLSELLQYTSISIRFIIKAVTPGMASESFVFVFCLRYNRFNIVQTESGRYNSPRYITQTLSSHMVLQRMRQEIRKKVSAQIILKSNISCVHK